VTRAVTVEARAVLDLPAARFLSWFVPQSPVGLFPAWGPIPGVVAVHDQRGAWTTPGSRRVLEMSDGSRTGEEVIAFDPPDFFAYRMSGFAGVMARLVTAIEGEWRCTMRADGRVAVTWRYAFADRGAPARLVLRVMTATVWRGYMRVGLSRVAAAAEQDAGLAPASADRQGVAVRHRQRVPDHSL
jgi:hypothetical protein